MPDGDIINAPAVKQGRFLWLDISNAFRYYIAVIMSFKSEETSKIWAGDISRKLPQDIQRVALRKLVVLNAATDVTDLRTPPGNRLEALKDDRRGQHSIRINSQWRICFVWRDGDAYDVEIVDYH